MARSGRKSATKVTSCDADGCIQKKSRITQTNSLSRCPYKNADALQQLSDSALSKILDIEDLVKEGKQLKSCPYYAVRTSVQDAQLVMLPYQMLLHRSTRLQSSIDLRGSVVIIDEAHNLLDTISQLYSCEVTLEQLLLVKQQIIDYKSTYAKRFNSHNLLSINQLLFVIKCLVNLLQPKMKTETENTSNSRVLRTYELMSEGEFFNIDLFQLLQFAERTRFAQKLQGFTTNYRPPSHENKLAVTSTVGLLRQMQSKHLEKQRRKSKKESPILENHSKEEVSIVKRVFTASPLRPLLTFIEALTNDADDGRIVVTPSRTGGADGSYKYFLLNPGSHFNDIIKETRAIIVAGGTMKPINELTEQIFQNCLDRVRVHVYDHVIKKDAVLSLVVDRGPTNRQICFNYAQRCNENILSELGMIVQNICSVVPAGVVCFLPSFEYLDKVYKHLHRQGVLDRISIKKQIFCEPRSNGIGQVSVEQMLTNYANAIKSKQGALLFSVVGGKLSEGINFKDDLGRGIIVVGLPYPNRQSAELQERIKYLDETLASGAGNEYYENLCMKAVNQCIGRSVRHIKDYATVFLLDERYNKPEIQKKLPQWILRNLQSSASSFGKIQAATAKFFKEKLIPI